MAKLNDVIGKKFPAVDNDQDDKTKSKIKSERNNGGNNSEDDRPKYPLQKYSDASIIAESILIGNVSYFLVSKNGTIDIKAQLEFGDRILIPFESISYINRPYSFSSKEEVYTYIEQAKNETLDSLYQKVKNIWKKVHRCR